ncbi:MAG: hypothetical protein WC344_01320 [Bacilli bacterium]|jgi:NADH/NAD ratio-sensing transcriptional regulator Rex
MNGPSLSNVRKYVAAIKKSPRKYLTSENLSKELGIFPDVINRTLSHFDPLVNMDFTYDVRALIPAMEAYIDELASAKKKTVKPRAVVSKKDLSEYDSILDFIFKKFVFESSGLFDRSTQLGDADLRVLKRLVTREQNERKSKKNKK